MPLVKLPLKNRPPLLIVRTLPVALPLPMLTTPTLLTVPPVTVKTLPVAAPLPMVRFVASRFQTALVSTLTVLFEAPLPIVAPLLQRFALVTVI